MDPSSSAPLMKKLRDKFSRRPWAETMKHVRSCMDKPRQATSDCATTACLERIEDALHGRSLSSVINRLESLSKEKGLDCYVSPSGTTFYVTSDTFYIEIHLENDGAVKDVKLAQPAKSFLTCEDLLQCLRMQNYYAFGRILDKLLHLYQMPGNSSTKHTGHVALRAVEQDLCSLSDLHRTPDMNRVAEILSGKVGYIRPRTEGRPLSIEFYLSAYQILEEELNPGLEVSGMKAFLTMGPADETHTLSLSPLILDSTSGEDASFDFLPLAEVACVDLLACFFLTFDQPFPMSLSSLQELQKLTGIPVAGLKPAPLQELIVQLALSEKCKDDPTMSNYFYVSLPDIPKQSFFIDTSTEKFGAMVNNLPFAHYKCVPDIIEILRCQAAYNTLLSSCTSEYTKCEDLSDLLYYEVSPRNGNSLLVTFQHPLQDNLACVAIEVLNSREVRCILYAVPEEEALNCSNDYLTRVIKRCMSIPILMRAIFKRAAQLKAAEAIQCVEGTSEQNPNENEQSDVASSVVILSSPGDYTASVSPEGSLPETSRQASQYSSTGESASVGPSSAGTEKNTSPESSGYGMEESASVGPSSAGTEKNTSPESSGDGMEESASVGPSSAGTEKNTSPESSGYGMEESASVGPSSAGTEKNTSPESSGDDMEESASVGPSSAGTEKNTSPESSGYGMEESASVGPSSAGTEKNTSPESSGDDMEESASVGPSSAGTQENTSPESSGDDMEESASVGPSSAGTEENMSPESSGDGTEESASVRPSSAATEEHTSPESLGDGMEETASVGPSSAGTDEHTSPESSGDGMEETASVGPSSAGTDEHTSPESSGDGMEEGASAGPSSAGMEKVSLESSGCLTKDELFLTLLQLTDDESTVSVNSPVCGMEDYGTDYFFSPESME